MQPLLGDSSDLWKQLEWTAISIKLVIDTSGGYVDTFAGALRVEETGKRVSFTSEFLMGLKID